MNKILYVEDDIQILKRFVSRDGLFRSLLSPEEKNNLFNKRGEMRPAYLDCIKDNQLLTVKYSFLDALKIIVSNEVYDYDCFIFDRNLSQARTLDVEDVKKIDKGFSEHYLKYIQNEGSNLQREGDYLLIRLYWRLSEKNLEKKLANNFFFFSAFEPKDVFRKSNSELYNIISKIPLSKENYLMKEDEDIQKLESIIRMPPEEYQIRSQYKQIFSFFNDKPDRDIIIQDIIEILTETSLSKGTGQTCERLSHLVDLARDLDDKVYIPYFDHYINKQSSIINAYANKLNCTDKTSRDQAREQWYSDGPQRIKGFIPPNIIECGYAINRFSNVFHHNSDKDWTGDFSVLMIKAMVFTLFEIIRVLGPRISYNSTSKRFFLRDFPK